jgi:predicted amidohydrolase YtcJ
MILTNARILTLDRDNSVFDAGSVKIRKDGSIGAVGEIAAVPGDTTFDARGKLLMPDQTISSVRG